jgi:hypothetical protein
MGRITQIAAVENATAIWEYNPSLPNNCVLGGSLDIIAAIHMITVKVSSLFTVPSSLTLSIRSKCQGSESNISRSSSFNARSPNHLGFHFTATSDGGQRTACLTAHIGYNRQVKLQWYLLI